MGPVVSAISKSFDEYWNSGLSHSIGSLLGGSSNNTVSENYRNQIYEYMRENQDSNYARAITESNFSRAFTQKSLEIFWGDVRLIVDSVEKLTADRSRVDLHLSGEMSRLFETAEDEIIIFSPYLIPGKQGTAGLTQLVSNGVKVRLLTNSAGSNNHAVVHAHYSKYRLVTQNRIANPR